MEEKEVKKNYQILAVGAHPDDVEFLMSGTLKLLREKGYAIHITTLCRGDCGSAELRGDEIARIRFFEATKAAQMLEGIYECLGISDQHLIFDNLTRRLVTELIRRVNPFIVFTTSPGDYIEDHDVTSRLVKDACLNAAVPNYITSAANPAKPVTTIPYLYYADPMEGITIFGEKVKPHFYVDITSVIDFKAAMLACHETQRAWLRKLHKMDRYIENMRELSAQRGQEIGVQYAEGFRQHRGHPYPKNNILEEIIVSLAKSANTVMTEP